METPFPEDVRTFIEERIGSLEALEILLLLHTGVHREWTPIEVANELRTTEFSASDRLRELEQRELLVRAESGAVRYRYQARTSELDRLAQELLRLYGERRVTVIELIFSKPLDKIRSFADAFRFRKR